MSIVILFLAIFLIKVGISAFKEGKTQIAKREKEIEKNKYNLSELMKKNEDLNSLLSSLKKK